MNWITDIRRGAQLAALVLTLTVFSPLPARAGINRWTSSGPDVAGVSRVAIDPMHFAVVYASSQRGVFKSSDGGASWTDPSSGKLDGINIHSLAIDPLTPSSIYVGTSNGVLKSADGGASWSNRLTASAIYNLIFGSQKSTIYAADFDDGAYYYPGPSVVYKSTDDAESWSRSPSGFSIVPGTLLIDPTQPSTVYAASYDRAVVQKSVDAGSTWSMASGDLGYVVNALAIDARHSTTLYAGNYQGIFKSVDASSTWRLASSDLNISHYNVSSLAIDPRDSNTLYAGTYSRGVFRSTDGGATWGPFNEGLSSLVVTALAIDRTGTMLHAATASGVFDIQIAPVIYPCDPAPDHLCSLSLLSGRFQISVSASDADKGVLAIGQAVPQGDEFGYFSLPQLMGDPALPEVVVKMVDATSLSPYGGWFWVFYSALTSLSYEITVTDTATGQVRTYWSDGFCGGADASAFPGGAAAGARNLSTVRTTLSASGDTLSLLGNRFQATLTATDPRDGTTAPGAAIPQGDRFGYFSLPAFTGNPNFPEVFVKMIDATSLPGGDFWLFHTGLTDLRYTLTVTDSVTGAVKTYQNEPSDPTRLCGGADTAFSVTAAAPPDARTALD